MLPASRPASNPPAIQDEETTNLSWVKLDDQFHWHPKMASLSSDAYRLFIGGLCVCNSHRTGGVIWRSRFGMAAEGVKAPKKALGELLEADIWVEIEGGWEVHDYGVYQLTSEAAREAAREAGRKSGEARRHRTANAALNEIGTEYERSVQRRVERNPNEIEPATQARAPAQARALDPLPEPVPVVPTGLRPSGTPNPVPVASPPLPPLPRGGSPPEASEGQIFEAWQESVGASRAVFTAARRKRIRDRLREGYSVEDLVDAVRGWVNDPWPERVQHNELGQLLRDGAHVEKFRDLWRNGAPATRAKAGGQSAFEARNNAVDDRVRALVSGQWRPAGAPPEQSGSPEVLA